MKHGRAHIPHRVKLKVAFDQNYQCKNCEKTLNQNQECDHIIPIAAGGTNDPTNLQILCADCHRTKTAQDVTNIREYKKYSLATLFGKNFFMLWNMEDGPPAWFQGVVTGVKGNKLEVAFIDGESYLITHDETSNRTIFRWAEN